MLTHVEEIRIEYINNQFIPVYVYRSKAQQYSIESHPKKLPLVRGIAKSSSRPQS